MTAMETTINSDKINEQLYLGKMMNHKTAWQKISFPAFYWIPIYLLTTSLFPKCKD